MRTAPATHRCSLTTPGQCRACGRNSSPRVSLTSGLTGFQLPQKQEHLCFSLPGSFWSQIQLCLVRARSCAPTFLSWAGPTPGRPPCSCLAQLSSPPHLSSSAARNRGFANALPQGWLSLLSRHRQPSAGDRVTLCPCDPTLSLTSPPCRVLSSQQHMRLAAGSPWPPRPTPPQETREQSSSLALPLCPEEKGWQSLCLLRLCSWCQHKTPGGTPAHTFSPGREVESHDYRQTPPSKRSRNKATALPVRTTVTEVNIPERFVSRASKLSQELTERILHPSGSGWQEHFPLGPHIFSVFASPQKHHL